MTVEMSAPLTSKQAAWQKWYAKVKADPQWQERRKAQKAESRAKPSCKRQQAVTDWLWAACNRDKLRINSRRHYAKHLEAQRERGRLKQQRVSPERKRQLDADYRHAHRDIRIHNESKRRAQKRGSAVGDVNYDLIILESNGVCGICHMSVSGHRTHFDHIIPLSKGGAHIQSNLQLAHARCNLSKRDSLTVGER